MRKTALFILALAAAGCETQGGPRTTPPAKDPYIGVVNANGKSVVLVIDKSLSMNFNDGRHFNEQGSNLAVAISASADNVGLVAFSTEAEVRAKLQQMEAKANRLELQRQINALGREGQTNYAAGLREAAQMFARSNAGAGASVIFMTDGENNCSTPEEVYAQTTIFAQRGWKAYVIALGDEAKKSQLAKEIALRTEAAYFEANQPEELMNAFLKILAQINTFVEFSGGIRPISVLPGTRRLVYLMIKEAPETTISKLTLGGSTMDWQSEPNIYKYPVHADRRGDFEALNIEDPKPGVWEATITGPAKVGMILAQPAFSLSLEDGAPRSDYRADEEIKIVLKAEGNAEAIKILAKTAKVKVTITGPTGTKVAEFELKASGEGKWSGSTTAKLDKADQEELQQVVVSFSYEEQGGGAWSHEKRATVAVKSGERKSTITLSTNSIDFGAIWAGETASAEVELSNGGNDTANLTVKSDGEIAVNPGTVPLAPGARKTVSLKLTPKGDGPGEATVVIEGKNTDGSRVVVKPVKATWRVFKIIGNPSIDLGNVKPGETFKVPVDYQVEGKKLKIEPSIKGAEDVKVVEEDGKTYITGRIPKDAEEGEYKGEVRIGIVGETLPPRVIPAKYEIGAIPLELVVTPKSIEIKTAKEDEEEFFELKLTVNGKDAKSVKIIKADLKSKSGTFPSRRQDFKGKDWDVKSMKVGQEYILVYAVTPGNDDEKTDYEGILKIQVNDGKKTKEFDIPVKVTLTK